MGRGAIHPGGQLAEQLGVPPNRITAILHGRRAITGDRALRLGHFFWNSPQFWLNFQAQAARELRIFTMSLQC
jgi:addiction module HigA family antidote